MVTVGEQTRVGVGAGEESVGEEKRSQTRVEEASHECHLPFHLFFVLVPPPRILPSHRTV